MAADDTSASRTDLAGRDESVEVNQAVGMVMAQLGTGPHAAIATLYARAMATRQTVDDVAGDVLAGTWRPRPTAGQARSQETPADR